MTLPLGLDLHAAKLSQVMESTSMSVVFIANTKDNNSALSASWHCDFGVRRSEVHP